MVTITQAMKELQKLQQLHERRPGGAKRELSEVEFARLTNFLICKTAHGKANKREAAFARQACFAVAGSPEIGPEWGPKEFTPIVAIDAGKPNQVAAVEPASPVVPDTRNWMDDNGKVPAALPRRDVGRGGQEQR